MPPDFLKQLRRMNTKSRPTELGRCRFVSKLQAEQAKRGIDPHRGPSPWPLQMLSK
jgi:hypothetical protein